MLGTAAQGARPRAIRIGLTGGIGSGKSTVAGMLRDLGATLIDTDAIARALTLPGGRAIKAIAQRFGAQFIGADGAMDRDRMRALVFRDPAQKKVLQDILHPLILSEALSQAEAAVSDVIVFDIPLLVESGHWRERVDQVWVVDCAESTQIQRVMGRNGWRADEVQAVMGQQASRQARLAVADVVISNEDVSMSALRNELSRLMAGLGRFGTPGEKNLQGA
jgi:dephospho-CoA kinase